MTVTNVIRNVRSSPDTKEDPGPYSVYRNWRVPDFSDLPEAPSNPPKPINRKWLKELLEKHPNPATPKDLQEKALVVAPMVDQSDLAFRLQCRKYGANLCFTPMIHSRLFQENEKYHAKFVCDSLPASDRPVVAQLCGPDPYIIVKTAKEIAPFVDAIDLNCGCPQGIAKRGLYGAFLLEEEDLLLSIVRELVHHLPDTPICVKVRLLPTGLEDSLKLYTKLVDCGIAMLTIHGRDRHQTNYHTGPADWEAIAKVVELLGDRIPVLANGMIASLDDVRKCLEITKADGIMSSEAILEYPPLFMDEQFHCGRRTGPSRLQLAREYLDLAKQFPPERGGQGSGLKTIRVHVHKILHEELQSNPEFRMVCVNAKEQEELESCLVALEEIYSTQKEDYDASMEGLSWYLRHRGGNSHHRIQGDASVHEEEEASCMGAGFFGNDSDDESDDEPCGAGFFGDDDESD